MNQISWKKYDERLLIIICWVTSRKGGGFGVRILVKIEIESPIWIENMTDSQGRGQVTNHWQDRDADPDLEKEPRDIPNKQEKEARFTTMNIKPYLFQKQPPPQLRSVLLGVSFLVLPTKKKKKKKKIKSGNCSFFTQEMELNLNAKCKW
ncbi:hypothetical protein KFK09_015743 [Dendrobium nobile]|uniref:Uncharacterized protein n=1 Tax=Dendrobium nobile TaxID=94219 RepID=A0A8T3B5N7_DENNO|nr:hypothetical protein KFK09_015743 [Dendrobium nobile]